jgi:hypothetical protein
MEFVEVDTQTRRHVSFFPLNLLVLTERLPYRRC